MAMLRGDARLDQALPHGRRGRGVATGRAVEDFRHPVQSPNFVVSGQRGVVGDIIGVSRETVKGVHMHPQAASDQQGAHRKILTAAPLAGGRLDAVGPLLPHIGRSGRHHRYPLTLNHPTASAIASRAGRGA